MVEANGFRPKKSQGCFVKRIEGGTQSLGIPLWDYNPLIEFSLNMTMRIDAAEELTNLFSGSPAKYHSMTVTIITQLEHLSVSRCRWKAETQEELESELALVKAVVQDRILPFFHSHRDLMTIAVAANPEVAPMVPPVPNGLTTGMGLLADRVLFSSGNHPYRAMSNIALAHLARLPYFDELIERYRKELGQENEKFEQLIRYLKERRSSEAYTPGSNEP